jgi:hypothetical protein
LALRKQNKSRISPIQFRQLTVQAETIACSKTIVATANTGKIISASVTRAASMPNAKHRGLGELDHDEELPLFLRSPETN